MDGRPTPSASAVLTTIKPKFQPKAYAVMTGVRAGPGASIINIASGPGATAVISDAYIPSNCNLIQISKTKES